MMIEYGATNWDEGLRDACQGGHIELAELMIAHGATDWDKGLYNVCRNGHIELVKLMIAHGATDWNLGLRNACYGGHIELVELMIAHGATDWDGGLRSACYCGNIELAELMIAHGATDWDAAHDCSQNMRDYIKAQQKLHDAKAAPIIRMLRHFIVRLRSAKRIQQWWRGTYPLWRELAYAPPKGYHYLRGLKHFEKVKLKSKTLKS